MIDLKSSEERLTDFKVEELIPRFDSGRREERSETAAFVIAPLAYNGFKEFQAQGSAPGIVAKWRQIRFTTGTPSDRLISS